ncbi:MAG: hypothetical protein EHM20_03710, partial [Alphaproteobacteria bacterium]
MKILNRNYGHRNLIIFLILSLVYLQAIYSLTIGRSLFSLVSLRSFVVDHYFILGLTAVTGHMVTKVKKFSELFLLVCLIVIVGKSFFLLSDSFNKLTLILNFIYTVFAFYFFITWELEVAQASFNPNFTSSDLVKEARFKLDGMIRLDGDLETGVPVRITNIDQQSCFLLLPPDAQINFDPSALYSLESNFEGVRFQNQARLVSSYDRG